MNNKEYPKCVTYGQLITFYGPLLTKKQQELIMLHHDHDMSYSEIASHFGTSRQAVHEVVSRAEKRLDELESNLKLVLQFHSLQQTFGAIDSQLRLIEGKNGDLSGNGIGEAVSEIRKAINPYLEEESPEE